MLGNARRLSIAGLVGAVVLVAASCAPAAPAANPGAAETPATSPTEPAPEMALDGRARAWVFVRAENAQSVAEGIYGELGHEGGDKFVVVRADVVDYDYNVMIPIDAESREMVDEVVAMIKGHPGVEDIVVVWVQSHIPYPPHDANGYITVEEAGAGKEPIEPGRQGASPGYNGWG